MLVSSSLGLLTSGRVSASIWIVNGHVSEIKSETASRHMRRAGFYVLGDKRWHGQLTTRTLR
jgi:hypothetical protein